LGWPILLLPVTKPVQASENDWPAVLKAWRARKGLTQKEAAEFLKTPLVTFRKWEQGVSKPYLSPRSAKIILSE